MQNVVDDAVVLRCWDFSETSQTVALLTASHGAVRGLAKGCKRPTETRFSGGFELLTRGELVAILKPTTELAVLTEWDLRSSCTAFRRSLLAHRVGMYLVDLAYHAITDPDPHPEAFAALVAAMDSIAHDASRAAIARTLVRYLWEMLVACGYEPRLDVPEGHSASRVEFSPSLGVFGTAGSLSARDVWGVRTHTLSILQRVRAGDGCSTDEPASVGRAARLLSVYWRHVLARELPTRTLVFQANK